MSELPQGWTSAIGDDLFSCVRGVTYSKSDASPTSAHGLVPILRANNIISGRIVTDDLIFVPNKYVSNDQHLQNGDLLIASSSGSRTVVGKAAPAESFHHTYAFGAFCTIARPRAGYLGAWLSVYIRSRAYRDYIERVALGININNLRGSDLKAITIPLPPLPEQRRIVAKIDNLTGKSRRARDHLDHIPRLVEKYKQAILAAAFDEAMSCTDTHHTLGDIAIEVRNGLGKKPTNGPQGVPILRISSVRARQVHLDDIRYYQDSVPATAYLRNGDLLFTRYNGNPHYTAICGCVRNVTTCITYPDKLIRVRLDANSNSNFVEFMCSSPQTRQWLAPHIKSAAGQHGISGSDLKRLPIPIPSSEKQAKIARKTQAAFAWIDRLAADATSARKLIDHLDQAILAKAFRGELVPQDPNDEPASVLLDRIRAEREAAPKAKRGRKKTA